jgi:hypothetical protein
MPALRSSVITKRITESKNQNMRVEFNPKFLDSSYARKVCIVERGFTMWFPEQYKAHSHNSGHWLIPLVGEQSKLAYVEKDDIFIIALTPGVYYYVSPNIPHQLQIKGLAVLESYSSIVGMIRAKSGLDKITEYNENFFEIGTEIKQYEQLNSD